MELFSLFEKGGLVMYPLLICSIAAIANVFVLIIKLNLIWIL